VDGGAFWPGSGLSRLQLRRKHQGPSLEEDGAIRVVRRGTSHPHARDLPEPAQRPMPMVNKRIGAGRFGRFLRCSDYPACRTNRPIHTEKKGSGLPPRNGGGFLAERKSRFFGKEFLRAGVVNYPKCKFRPRGTGPFPGPARSAARPYCPESTRRRGGRSVIGPCPDKAMRVTGARASRAGQRSPPHSRRLLEIGRSRPSVAKAAFRGAGPRDWRGPAVRAVFQKATNPGRPTHREPPKKPAGERNPRRATGNGCGKRGEELRSGRSRAGNRTSRRCALPPRPRPRIAKGARAARRSTSSEEGACGATEAALLLADGRAVRNKWRWARAENPERRSPAHKERTETGGKLVLPKTRSSSTTRTKRGRSYCCTRELRRLLGVAGGCSGGTAFGRAPGAGTTTLLAVDRFWSFCSAF